MLNNMIQENIECYELILKDEEDGTFALSFVENPAIQQDFIYFGEGKDIMQFASVDNDKRLVVGAILIPDTKIIRAKEDGSPYYVQFSKDTVAQIAQKYIKDNNANNITLEHNKPVKGISLVESWVAQSMQYDKARVYGLPVKLGGWYGVFAVNNEDIWQNYVKTGKVKGISLEGLFSHELIKASMIDESIFDKDITELNEAEALVILTKLKYSIKSDKRFKSGKTMLVESHSDYGASVKGNAKRALEYADKNGWGSCGTPVGKQRANQLAKGEPISVDTIKRMYSFLSRHEGDLISSTAYGDGCGKLMYDAWGGKSGLSWSRNKLRELGLLTENEVGVPHYTEDGILWEGPTHIGPDGGLMTGEVHDEDSKPLFHKEKLEGEPSIPNSSYAGGTPKKKKYVHPALLGTKK